MIKPHWCMQLLTTCTPQNAVFKGFSGLRGGRNHIPPGHRGAADEVWHLSRPWSTGTCGTSQTEIGAGAVWNTWAETLRPNKNRKNSDTGRKGTTRGGRTMRACCRRRWPREHGGPPTCHTGEDQEGYGRRGKGYRAQGRERATGWCRLEVIFWSREKRASRAAVFKL